MAFVRVLRWAMIFLLRMRFPFGKSLAGVLEEQSFEIILFILALTVNQRIEGR